MGDRLERLTVARVCMLVLLLTTPRGAHADTQPKLPASLQEINRLYEELEYERALDQIQLVRVGPHSSKEELLLSLYEGIILCEQGKQPKAREVFKPALLAMPDIQLPVQVAPKIEQLFEETRAQVKRELAATAAQRVAEAPSVQNAPPPQAGQPRVPRLDPPPPTPSTDITRPTVEPATPLTRRWYFWAGVGAVAVAGVATTLALTRSSVDPAQVCGGPCDSVVVLSGSGGAFHF